MSSERLWIIIDKLQHDMARLKTIERGSYIWTNWTPSAQIGWTAIPTGSYRYCVIGKLVIIAINMTAGTSNTTGANIALPFTAASTATGTNGKATNNGIVITTATRWNIVNSGDMITFYTNMGTALWTASGTKLISCIAQYEKG